MEDRIKRLVSGGGFIEAFWERLRADRAAGGKTSQREIFEQLNDEYYDFFGVDRFPSFGAFRMFRDRRLGGSSK